jgi:hypothetical protein
MATTKTPVVKKAITKKKVTKKPVTKKVSAKTASDETAVVKKEETSKPKKGFFKTLFENVTETLDHVTENVAEGATFVTEKVKETTAKAYVASAELVEEANEKIHQFTDKQSLNKEKHRIEEAQANLTLKFGDITLQHYLKNESLHRAFLNTKAVTNLVLKYKANEKQLLNVEKELKKLEK